MALLVLVGFFKLFFNNEELNSSMEPTQPPVDDFVEDRTWSF